MTKSRSPSDRRAEQPVDQTSITSADEIMPYKFWHLSPIGTSQQAFVLSSIPVQQESPCVAFPIRPTLLEEAAAEPRAPRGVTAAGAPGPHTSTQLGPEQHRDLAMGLVMGLIPSTTFYSPFLL